MKLYFQKYHPKENCYRASKCIRGKQEFGVISLQNFEFTALDNMLTFSTIFELVALDNKLTISR